METHPLARKYFYVAGAETTASANEMRGLGILLLFWNAALSLLCLVGGVWVVAVNEADVFWFLLLATVFVVHALYIYRTLPRTADEVGKKRRAELRAEREELEERKRIKELRKEMEEE